MFLLLFLLPCLSTLRPGSGVGTNTKVRPSEQRKVQDELEMPSLPPQSRVVSQGGRTHAAVVHQEGLPLPLPWTRCGILRKDSPILGLRGLMGTAFKGSSQPESLRAGLRICRARVGGWGWGLGAWGLQRLAPESFLCSPPLSDLTSPTLPGCILLALIRLSSQSTLDPLILDRG